MRYTLSDWVQLGFALLREGGPSFLTVERLCLSAKRTTGSFYHHFKDHDAFILALMEKWKARNASDVITQVETGGADEATELNVIASSLDHHLEGRIRQLALVSDTAKKVVAEIDHMRIRFLTDIHERKPRVKIATAQQLAKLEYASWVGAQMLWPDAPPSEFEELGEIFTKLVLDKEQAG